MRDDEVERPLPKPKHQVGEPLETLSVEELRLRIALLHEEIARLETVMAAKQVSRDAAAAFFKH